MEPQRPDRQKAKAESKADGKLVTKIESVFVNPTDYSPLKQTPPGAAALVIPTGSNPSAQRCDSASYAG
jgi:hypothetical protein